MPSGIAHRRIAALALIVILAVVARHYEDLVSHLGVDPVFEYTFLFCLGILTGTYLLSPDLDLAGSDPAKSWGIVQAIWLPYAKLFRHRGISHVPVLGTLSRLIYLAIIVGLVWLAALSLAGEASSVSIPDPASLVTPGAICLFSGLVASDLIHLVADRFFSS